MRGWFIIILWLVLPALAGGGVIEGRVMDGDEPLPNVTVAAYATLDFTRTPIAVALPSEQDGSYRLELPEGTYALFGWNDDRSRFAFCGRNPVNVNADPVWAGMQVVPVEPPARHAYSDAYTAAVEGYALYQGQALPMATVYLYLDVAEDLKGQGYRLSLPTAEDGYFRFDGLPESDYFLVLRQRQSGQRVGPVAGRRTHRQPRPAKKADRR